jgi:hypothetical protein
MRLNMRRKWFFIAPAAILGMLLFAFIGGQIVRLLWNWLVPGLFGLGEITFWQALGLLALSRILFGGHGFCRSGSRNRSPEERERIRQAMRTRFGLSRAEPRGVDPGDLSSAPPAG